MDKNIGELLSKRIKPWYMKKKRDTDNNRKRDSV